MANDADDGVTLANLAQVAQSMDPVTGPEETAVPVRSRRDGREGEPLRILILDAHSDAALACLQSLGRAGYETCLAGARDDVAAWHSRYAAFRVVYPDPQRDRQAFVRWLRDLDGDMPIDYILPVTDATLHPLMEAGQAVFRAHLILPPRGSFETAFDKDKTVELARKLGVPVPASRLVATPDVERSQLGTLPLYLKPIVSKVWCGGEGSSLIPSLVRTEQELEHELRRLLAYGPVLAQECVPGDGVGIEVLCDQGEVVMSFAHRRLHEVPLTGGRSTYRVSIEMPPALFEAAARLMRALRWHGVAMVEFKQDGERFWLMEINGRFWGSLPLAIHAGVDFPRALMDLVAYGSHPAPQGYRKGVYARNLASDLAWLRANARADRSDLRLKTHNPVISFFELSRVLLRREAWDHFCWRDPGPGWWQLRQIVRSLGDKLTSRLRHARTLRRAAADSVERLQDLHPRNILVLCHGNIYRSPFARGYLAARLASDARYRVDSAGFHPRAGRSSPPEFVELARRRGVELRQHRSSCVDDRRVAEADVIVIMDRRNHEALRQFGPDAVNKAVWLGAFAGDQGVEIDDPYGTGPDRTEAVLDRLVRACEGFVAALDAPPPRPVPPWRRLKRGVRNLIAHGLYYGGVLHVYKRLRLRGKGVVLAYHRVLPGAERRLSFSSDGIIVERDVFACHLAVLKRHFQLVSVEEFAERLERGRLEDYPCLVTLDDGWQDNYEHAYPLLREHQAPAVIFLPSGYIGTGKLFWQERMGHALFRLYHQQGRLTPEFLKTNRLGDVFGADDVRGAIKSYVACIKEKPYREIDELLERLESVAHDLPPIRTPDRYFDWEAARALAKNGVALGSHAVSHRILTRLASDELEREVGESKQEIEGKLGERVFSFAYPNGNVDARVEAAVRQQGYRVAFTTKQGYVSPGDDPYRLRRINIHHEATYNAPLFLSRVLGLL